VTITDVLSWVRYPQSDKWINHSRIWIDWHRARSGRGDPKRFIKQHIVTLTGLPLKTGTGLSPASAWRGQHAG